jgi:ankyrin repeat protein
VRAAGPKRRTPLGWACSEGHLECAKLLLRKGPTLVNKADEDARTPLMTAAAGGHPAVVEWLIVNAGADVTLTDSGGATALALVASVSGEVCVMFITRVCYVQAITCVLTTCL